MTLLNHFPALQVLLPFFGALFAILTFHRKLATRIIAVIFVGLSIFFSIYGLSVINQQAVSYDFGSWHAPFGIEYRLDSLNQPIIVYINCVLLFFLIFGNKLTSSTIVNFINNKRQSLFYAVLLFAHSGYLGMLSTNDLFNLYVFIEISSLSSYVLMAQGNNPKAVVGAFDYLMLGSIGATLILIGIGCLLGSTGSLNMLDIAKLLESNYNSRIVMLGISCFLIGAILKTAFFPLHFWMIRAYSAAAPIILTYLAGVSSIIGMYVILRFIHFTIDYNIIINNLAVFIRPIALLAIVLCTYFANKEQKVRNIVIYSAAGQIGYMFLLLVIPGGESLLLPLLFADSINKIALFLIIAYHDEYGPFTMFGRVLVAFNLICSCGLPISSMFFIKVSILELLFVENRWLEVIIVIAASATSLLYHYNIAKKLYEYGHRPNYTRLMSWTKYLGLIFISIIQIFLPVLLSNLQLHKI